MFWRSYKLKALPTRSFIALKVHSSVYQSLRLCVYVLSPTEYLMDPVGVRLWSF